MCEIFPEVTNCCVCFSLRVGMLFIAVASICVQHADEHYNQSIVKLCNICYNLSVDDDIAITMTGGAILSVLENDAQASYMQSTTMIQAGSDLVENLDLHFLYRHIFDFVITALTIHGGLFIVAGLFLLIADLVDEDGYAQVFVWLTLPNIILGTLTLLIMGLDCTVKAPRCLLGMDWLETALFIMCSLFFYGLWFYFITVANSYVVNGDTIAEIK